MPSPFSTERHGLILAVLIHLLAAEVFIFSFPVKDVAHKPSFVFLGSFLDPIDANLSVEKYSLKPRVIADFPDPEASPPPVKAVKPPAGIRTSGKKRLLKTTFLEDNSRASNKNEASDLLLDSTKIRFQSLKISPGGVW